VALIAGPTASGKTAMSLFLAALQNCVIINADSAQVYADIPVLSAQPNAREKESAPHRLFGYRDGIRACSAADWARDAISEITLAHAAGKLPILVGGTGLYLRTLLDGIAPVPEIDTSIRGDVRAMSTEAAYGALTVSDPEIATRLHANDDSRIKRALEVIRSTNRSLLDWRAQKVGGILESIELKPLLLLPPRQWLHARCDLRFLSMLENGAIDEVRALIERGLPQDAPLMRAIGVPEIAAMLVGEISTNAAIERGQAATRQYAKRQYTWFRNQTPDSWLRFEEEINDSTAAKFETLFQRM
jgi:tRNA dimethylallyltransferase